MENSKWLELKSKLVQKLLSETKERLVASKESYQSALEHSRSDDMKSEGKYDTRAIEAGYLASAKKQRMEELERELLGLERLVPCANDRVSLGSLVWIENEDHEQLYFICPVSAAQLELDNLKITSISITSPLAKEALGLEEGDAFEVETPKGAKEYTIIKVV